MFHLIFPMEIYEHPLIKWRNTEENKSKCDISGKLEALNTI